MRSLIAKSLVAAMVAFAGATAAHASPLVVQESSPVYSDTESYFDLVLHYSSEATVPLTIYNLLVEDVSGAGVSQTTQSCPGFNKTNLSYTLMPGQYCWVRAYPTGNSVAGKAELSDTTNNATNISKFVRASLEVRDGSSNTLVHVDLR